jgi:ABC-type transport system substrate-binding protein
MIHTKSRKRSFVGLALVLTVVLVLVTVLPACTGGTPETEKKLVMAYQYPMTWGSLWDPGTSGSGDSLAVISSVWEGLLGKNEDTGATEPRLATAWNYTSSGTPGTNWSAYYDFTIRQNIPFHNGQIMTAEDVKDSIVRVLKTDPDLGWYYASTARQRIAFNLTGTGEWGVEILPGAGEGGRDVVRVHMAQPWPSFEVLLATVVAIVPANYTAWATNPVGTGPFHLIANGTKASSAVKVRMEAVPNHWRKTANYDVLEYQVLPNAETKYAAMVAGLVDICQLWEGPLLEAAYDNPDITVINFSKQSVGNLLFMDLYDNISIIGDPLSWGWGTGGRNESPWQSLKVRQAAVLAIDKDAICDALGQTYMYPYGGYLMDYQIGYTERTPVPYDKAGAIALLGEVADSLNVSWQPTPPYGWEDWDWGTFWSLDTVIDVSTMIVADWEAVGIHMGDIQLIDWGTGLIQWAIGAKRGVTFHHTAMPNGSIHPGPSLEQRSTGAGAVERAFAGFWFPMPGPGPANWPAQPSYYWPLAYADQPADIAAKAHTLEDAILDLYGAPPILMVGGHWGYGERVASFKLVPGCEEWPYGLEYAEYQALE